jgi:hypothetical protein
MVLSLLTAAVTMQILVLKLCARRIYSPCLTCAGRGRQLLANGIAVLRGLFRRLELFGWWTGVNGRWPLERIEDCVRHGPGGEAP